jgi:hypothetical protein
MDEVDYFDETAGKRGAWAIYEKLKNSTATFKADGHLVAISSPKTASGIIRSLVDDGKNDPHSVAVSLPTWEMNPHITFEELEQEYKYNMTALWRDFGCQPEIAGGLQFPEGIKLTPMPNVLKIPGYRDKEPVSRVMAIDPAIKNDGFGIACARRDHMGNIIVDGAMKFTRKDGKATISPDDVSQFIYSAIPRLNINAFVFDTWMFPNIIVDVQTRFGIEPTKHIVNKEDYDRWRGLQEMPNQDYRLMIVEDEDLQREGDRLLVKSGDTRLPRVDHPFTGSKDIADCVCNCIWFLETQQVMDKTPPILILETW